MLTHHWPSTFQRRVLSRARSWSRVSSSLLVALAAIANADFTLVTESTGSPSQTSTVSLRGNTLRVSVKTNGEEVVLLREPSWALTGVTEKGTQRLVQDRPLSPNAGEPSLTYRFVPTGKKRVLLGRTCEVFTAVASKAPVSFAGCFAPWRDFGVDSEKLAALMPNRTTLGYNPELLQFTMSWTKMGPVFMAQLPGLPLELTTFFLEGPTSTVGIRATRLTKTALEASLFERPAVRPPEALDSKVNQPEGSRK